MGPEPFVLSDHSVVLKAPETHSNDSMMQSSSTSEKFGDTKAQETNQSAVSHPKTLAYFCCYASIYLHRFTFFITTTD